MFSCRTVHAYLVGRYTPTFAAVVKLARALGALLDELAACDDIAPAKPDRNDLPRSLRLALADVVVFGGLSARPSGPLRRNHGGRRGLHGFLLAPAWPGVSLQLLLAHLRQPLALLLASATCWSSVICLRFDVARE